MRRGIAVLLVAVLSVATVVVFALPAAAAQCKRVALGSAGEQDTGNVFIVATFADDDRNGVPNGFSADSDFTRAGCRRSISKNSEKHRTKILEDAGDPKNKASQDASIYRSYRASPGQRYSASAEVNLWSFGGGDFRGRLKISVWGNGKQLKEFFVDLCSPDSDGSTGACVEQRDDGEWRTISVNADLDPEQYPRLEDADTVKIAWRARRHRNNDAFGVAGLERLQFERLE